MKRRGVGGLAGRVAAGAAAGLAGGLPGARAAHAWSEWCDTDPVLEIETPGGRRVLVYYLTGVFGARHAVAGVLGNLSATYTAAPAPGGGTRVAVRVTVPDDGPLGVRGVPTRVRVSRGPWNTLGTYGAAEGKSGEAMTVAFTLDVP